jgi:hypothetical protein
MVTQRIIISADIKVFRCKFLTKLTHLKEEENKYLVVLVVTVK